MLTNEEASEMFDLDVSALLDEMMNEEDSFSEAGEEIAKKGYRASFYCKSKEGRTSRSRVCETCLGRIIQGLPHKDCSPGFFCKEVQQPLRGENE